MTTPVSGGMLCGFLVHQITIHHSCLHQPKHYLSPPLLSFAYETVIDRMLFGNVYAWLQLSVTTVFS